MLSGEKQALPLVLAAGGVLETCDVASYDGCSFSFELRSAQKRGDTLVFLSAADQRRLRTVDPAMTTMSEAAEDGHRGMRTPHRWRGLVRADGDGSLWVLGGDPVARGAEEATSAGDADAEDAAGVDGEDAWRVGTLKAEKGGGLRVEVAAYEPPRVRLALMEYLLCCVGFAADCAGTGQRSAVLKVDDLLSTENFALRLSVDVMRPLLFGMPDVQSVRLSDLQSDGVAVLENCSVLLGEGGKEKTLTAGYVEVQATCPRSKYRLGFKKQKTAIRQEGGWVFCGSDKLCRVDCEEAQRLRLTFTDECKASSKALTALMPSLLLRCSEYASCDPDDLPCVQLVMPDPSGDRYCFGTRLKVSHPNGASAAQ